MFSQRALHGAFIRADALVRTSIRSNTGLHSMLRFTFRDQSYSAERRQYSSTPVLFVERKYRKDEEEAYPDGSPRKYRKDEEEAYPDGSPRKYSLQPLPTDKQDNDDDEGNKIKSNLGRFASMAAFGSLLLGKTKYILVALKVTKFAPLASMVFTSFTYSLFFGWPYAVGMVGLIFVHECGHAIVMNHYKLPFSPMVFIPFMGAVISMKDAPKDAYQDAMIAFGGPILGGAGAGAVAVAGALTDSQLCYALADFGLMINLFNLLPIGQMDGGRIGGAIHPVVSVGGIAAGSYLVLNGVIQNPIIYLVLGAGAWSTGRRVLGYDDFHESYYRIGGEKKLGISVAYICLIGALLAAMKKNNEKRRTPKQLQRIEDGFEDANVDGKLYDDFFGDDNDDEDEGGDDETRFF